MDMQFKYVFRKESRYHKVLWRNYIFMFKDRETAFAFITHCTKYTASFFLHSIKNRSNLKE